MKIGIVGAMAQEVEILKNLMADRTETRVASAVILKAKLMVKMLYYYNQVLAKWQLPLARRHYCN